jgi:hypothetical protein
MGRARGAARSSRADVGLAQRGPGAAWGRACPSADVGIAAATGRRSAAGRTRTELGRPGAGSRPTSGSPSASRCSGVGRRCTRPVMGRSTAGVRGSAAGCATRAASPSGTRNRPAGPAGRAGPIVGRRCVGRPRAVMGGTCRCTPVTYPDRAVVEPAGAGLETSTAGRLCSGSTGFRRLGCAASVGCATADRCARVERSGIRVVGCSEDRRARGSRGAVVVGAGLSAERAAGIRTGAVELAAAGCSNSARTVVAPGADAGRPRARTQLHRRGAGSGSCVLTFCRRATA